MKEVKDAEARTVESCDSGAWGSGSVWTPSQDCQTQATLPFRGHRCALSESQSQRCCAWPDRGDSAKNSLATAVGSCVQIRQAQALLPYLDGGREHCRHGPHPPSQGLQPTAESRQNRCSFTGIALSVCVCVCKRESECVCMCERACVCVRIKVCI